MVSLFCPQKKALRRCWVSNTLMNMWSCTRNAQEMNCLLWKEASSTTMTCQTIRPAKRVHCLYQTQAQHQVWKSQSPEPQGTGSLAHQTKTFMGGRSKTQAAHQMFLESLLSSITQWDTAPNSTDRWDKNLHRAWGGTTQEDTKSSLLQLQATG